MKILLIEDDPIVRECVESLVKKSGGQLLIAATLEHGIELAANNNDIGLALLGVEHLRGRDAKFAKKLHAAHEQIPVVVLAPTEAEDIVLQALDAGAMGFINKHASTRSLLRALRIVLRGGMNVPVSLLKARGSYNLPQGSARSAMTAHLLSAPADDQRAAIARLMLHGRSKQAIAESLGLAEALVHAEVSSLLKAFAVTSRSELILVMAGIEILHHGSVMT